MKHLNKLKTGDAFWYNDYIHIVISLTEDPYDVYCLDTYSKNIIALDEFTKVEPCGDFTYNFVKRGKSLKVL